MQDRKSYWNNTADYSDAYTKLYAELVPDEGKCATIEGEILRAVSRIGYDYYNNGFGNVWSSSFSYLRDLKKNYPEIAGEMNTKNALTVLAPYKYGRMVKTLCRPTKSFVDEHKKKQYELQGIRIEDALLLLTDECVKVVIRQNGSYHENTVDSLEYDRSPQPERKRQKSSSRYRW